jgi:hypothetical protein
VSLRLTRVNGTSALNGDPVSIYRVEVLRDGFFDKYLYLPNDSIVLYGLRVWQHREAIPNEIIKMVGADPSDTYSAIDWRHMQQPGYSGQPLGLPLADSQSAGPELQQPAACWCRSAAAAVHKCLLRECIIVCIICP